MPKTLNGSVTRVKRLWILIFRDMGVYKFLHWVLRRLTRFD